MKKNQIILYIFIFFYNFCFAQEKTSKDLIYGNLSFGFETNDGNTGFLLGIGYQRNLSTKFIFQSDLHYYTTGIIDNKWQYIKYFPKEERFNRSAFLSVALGYAVIGKTDKFNITIKGGLSLFHIKSKTRGYYQAIFYPDGSTLPDYDPGFVLREHYIETVDGRIYGLGIVIPSTVRYGEVNKFDKGFNFGLDINIPIKKKHFLTIGFLSYSSDIPLQYLFCPIPVITYKLKL